jgi:hypothetical protein
VEDVCNEVSNLLGLKTNRDFRLFHEVGKKELRVLDQDKKLMKLFSFKSKESKGSGGLSLMGLIGAVKNFISPEEQPKLIFKKYYYLPQDIEHVEYKKDVTRLRLIFYQVLHEVRDLKYNLTLDDYILFLAILIYVEHDGQIPEQTQETYIAKVIPSKILKLKNETEEYWLGQCRPHMLWIREEINKIIQHNN